MAQLYRRESVNGLNVPGKGRKFLTKWNTAMAVPEWHGGRAAAQRDVSFLSVFAGRP